MQLIPFEDLTQQVIPKVSFLINEVSEKKDWLLRGRFEIQFDSLRDFSNLLRPPKNEDGSHRKDFLWEKTCVELFFFSKDNPSYWEFNFSPSQDWQAYFFTQYRQNRRPANCHASVSWVGHQKSLTDFVDIECHFSEKIPKNLRISPCAILYFEQNRSPRKIHFSGKHGPEKADFHSAQNSLE